MGNRKKLVTILGGLFLYLVSAGISYAAFRYLGKPVVIAPVSPISEKASGSRFDLSKPKTETCPVSGGLFTKDEKNYWEKLRPLTVMIENHQDSRLQSGLSSADVVYEAVAEGGITRFLAVYYCGVASQEVTLGPVRSARTYFMDFASEYGDYPLYAHVGGANVFGPANALGQIGDYGWLRKGNDLNQFAIGFPVFWRDYERIGHPVATEHTMYTTTDKLWEVAHKRDLDAQDEDGIDWDKNFVSWKFKKDAETDKRGQVNQISFDFWSDYSDYSVKWEYEKESNSYKRSNGDSPHKDLNNDTQIQAKTIVVQFMKEKGPIDAEKHMLYTTIGTGKALIFQDGQAVEGNWTKAKRQARTIFADNKGKEIEFNGGQMWIEVLPVGREVKY